MEPTIKLELTASEVQALDKLLDAAVKAAGMGAAKAAVPIHDKLEAAVAVFNNASASKPRKGA